MHIPPNDLAGVALVAAKGLQAENVALRAELADLRQRQVKQERAFEAKLATLQQVAQHSTVLGQDMNTP